METGRRLADLVDGVYVINLPHRTDRRAETCAELAGVGLDDPERLVVHPAICCLDAAGFPSPGLHGCFRSHLAVLRAALDAGKQAVLIVEDDVAFVPGFATTEPRLVELLETTAWDVVQLGWGDHDGSSGLRCEGPLELEPFRGEVIGLHCYLVRGGFLPRLIAFFEGLLDGPPGDPLHGPMSPDGAINVLPWRHGDVRRLVAVPSLADQRPSASDISPRWFDSHRFARVPARAARHVKRAGRRVAQLR